jgi:hypothetical protein
MFSLTQVQGEVVYPGSDLEKDFAMSSIGNLFGPYDSIFNFKFKIHSGNFSYYITYGR